LPYSTTRRSSDLHAIRLVQRAPRAYGEHDAARRHDAGRGPREVEKTAGPDRQRDGVAVVRVDDIGGPSQGFDDEPPPGPWVEPEAPGDLTGGPPLGRGPARPLAASLCDEPLRDAGVARQPAGPPTALGLTGPAFAGGADRADGHGPIRPGLSAPSRG